ncbi:MAG: LysR family transcriptional regulator, partial [Pseudomonadota bacterium]
MLTNGARTERRSSPSSRSLAPLRRPELGTVSAAAASLGYHRATVNRHIDALEAEIGARIFLRHAQGYTLTEVGHQVLRVAQKTKELTDDLSGRLKGASERLEGELRLSVLAPFVSMFLAPVAR